uniref:Uncharacterized protein n=1 Tax=Panagrolaimus davidi TaxID=227884 RepID=A0A914R1S5_9BILA
MSQNPPIKPKLNDVDYFNYFESQSDGWIYDEFCEQWEKFDLEKFDVITHFNTLQVYKLMIEKRCKRIEQIHRMWKISDEKDKNIKIVNQEKLEAIMEIDKLKSRIQELEFLWAQQKNIEEILQEKVKELESSVKSKNVLIQKYCGAENEVEKKREKFKAEITELQNKNQELQEALNIALNKYQEVKDEISAQNGVQKLALNELAKFMKECGNLQRMVTKPGYL